MSRGPEKARTHAATTHSQRLDAHGLRRVRRGRGFVYVSPSGRPVRNRSSVERIEALKIPPAWSDVRICPRASGRLQAIGFDQRGRLQYLYHPRFRARRDADKYERLQVFARVLPAIRRRVRRDLKRPGLSRATVLAAAVRLLDRTHVRIGNKEYCRANDSYGLTTLRNRHASVQGATVRLAFRGKSGVEQRIEVRDACVARVVRRCLKLPGRDLLGFLDEAGRVRDVTAQHVNAYLQEIAGSDFSAKDFRTWGGTVLAVRSLKARPAPESPGHARRQISQALEEVTESLRNTKAVCRQSYIHPIVFEDYEAGRLERVRSGSQDARGELSAPETLVARLLRGRGRRRPSTTAKKRA